VSFEGVEGQAVGETDGEAGSLDFPAKSESEKCTARANTGGLGGLGGPNADSDSPASLLPGGSGSGACGDSVWGKDPWMRVVSAAYVVADGGEALNSGGAFGLSAQDTKRRKIQKARMNTSTYRNRSKLTGVLVFFV
jgi:hypothetical protein